MSQATPSPLYRRSFDTAELVRSHPPCLTDDNKRFLYQLCCPPEIPHRGEITVSRWPAMSLSEVVPASVSETSIESRESLFEYDPTPPDSHAVEWYLNFANYDVFSAYGSPLFAQDEMQVAEHPALGSIREALLAAGMSAQTVEDQQPAPILVAGVERRCAVATEPDAAKGRPNGLYGNNFAQALETTIEQATRVLDPPTISNILAVEAPTFGFGKYTREQIQHITATAYTGFSAARAESQTLIDDQADTVIHTGFCGCGAYGGNRTLMTILQLLAAQLSGINRLVFHTVDCMGTLKFERARKMLADESARVDDPSSVSALLDRIEGFGIQWGTGDGT